MIVNEIYESIQGECEHQGRLTTFIRLAGCNLQCKYCDTRYANDEKAGKEMSLSQIIEEVKKLGNKLIEITGGEPLLQYTDVCALIYLLSGEGYEVDLETNGSINISNLPKQDSQYLTMRLPTRRCKVIMDIKAPGSDMDKYMFYDNISKLDEKDNLKFVVTSKDDMFWSKEVIEKYKPKCRIYFSPCIGYGDITLKDVAEFIIKNKISKNIRYSLQIHKIIWTPETRGV